jgi:hypothetical protein
MQAGSLTCPPLVSSVMLVRVISAGCQAAKSDVSSSGKSSRYEHVDVESSSSMLGRPTHIPKKREQPKKKQLKLDIQIEYRGKLT